MTAGLRTCDQEVASSIHSRTQLHNDCGQVVHTPTCLDADSLRYYVVVKADTFNFTLTVPHPAQYTGWHFRPNIQHVNRVPKSPVHNPNSIHPVQRLHT